MTTLPRQSLFPARIRETCWLLADNPGLGRLRDELPPRLRSFPVGRFTIFSHPIEGGIHGVRVVHGARDFSELLRV
jgi:toxin ParE1/3/4